MSFRCLWGSSGDPVPSRPQNNSQARPQICHLRASLNTILAYKGERKWEIRISFHFWKLILGTGDVKQSDLETHGLIYNRESFYMLPEAGDLLCSDVCAFCGESMREDQLPNEMAFSMTLRRWVGLDL